MSKRRKQPKKPLPRTPLRQPAQTRIVPALRRPAQQSTDPALHDPYHEACCLAEQGRYDDARTLLHKLVHEATEPARQAILRNDLAALAAAQGDPEAARRGFADALALDPTCLPAQQNLALLEKDGGAPDESSRSIPLPSAVLPQSLPARSATPIDSESAGRIALVSFLFNWPTTGGGNVHTYELACFLGKAGYEVCHFYVQYPPWGIGQVPNPLPYPSTALCFTEASWKLEEIQQRLRREVAVFDPDFAIITDSWNIKPLLAEALRGYPYVLRFQAMECICPLNGVRLLAEPGGRLRQCALHQLASPEACARCLQERGRQSGQLHQVERALSGAGTPAYYERLRQALQEAYAVLVVNPLHEAMLSPYTDTVRVVTAGMDPARFPAPVAQAEVRPGGKVRLFFAGLIEELMKGFDVLHHACSLLWQKRQDFELIATGDPPGPVDAFTCFIGWQSQDDLPQSLRETDILVMPTVAQEALGRTAVEAMAAGRPVVASRLGGLPFTVADGATGVLFEPGDAVDLARKLEPLLDDPDLRRRLGRAGRQRFEEHYSWDVIIERHYRPLFGDARQRRAENTAPMGQLPLPDSGPNAPSPAETALTAPSPYHPYLPDWVDHQQLLTDLSACLMVPRAEVEAKYRAYRSFHERRGYAELLGERKTLCFEEALVLYALLEQQRSRCLVEIGTGEGKATRRLLDILRLLSLETRVVCFDDEDRVEHFRVSEATLKTRPLRGRFRAEVLEAYHPDLILSDVHDYQLLREIVTQTLAQLPHCLLALHDCSRGLCNPHMTIRKEDEVTSSTGVWERHVLAETFGVADPLSGLLDAAETDTHRLRIFGTPHGLALILPKTEAPGCGSA